MSELSYRCIKGNIHLQAVFSSLFYSISLWPNNKKKIKHHHQLVALVHGLLLVSQLVSESFDSFRIEWLELQNDRVLSAYIVPYSNLTKTFMIHLNSAPLKHAAVFI